MRNFFRNLFNTFDAIDVAVPAILAAVLMIVGPICACVHFLRVGHKFGAGATAVLYGAALISCLRDYRKKEISNGSLAIIVLWLGITAWIWISIQ